MTRHQFSRADHKCWVWILRLLRLIALGGGWSRSQIHWIIRKTMTKAAKKARRQSVTRS